MCLDLRQNAFGVNFTLADYQPKHVVMAQIGIKIIWYETYQNNSKQQDSVLADHHQACT
jgi:hypothetical protein